MAKVKVAKIVIDGPHRTRVFLSNGDELEELTRVECSVGLDEINTFKIEGYMEMSQSDGQ